VADGDARYLMIVLTEPVPGREDEYHDWYTNRHLRDVVGLEGFQSAQRFRYVGGDEPPTLPFISIYEVREGQLERAQEALRAAREDRVRAAEEGREPILPASDAVARVSSWWFEAISDKVVEGGAS
jgi:hypothetical protein